MYAGDGVVLCRVLGKYLVYVDVKDVGIGARLALDGFWEAWITAAIARTVQPGWRCVDVGANHGYYTLVLADAAGPEGRVVAIEPSPRAAGLLEMTVELNGFEGFTTVLQQVAADRGGSIALRIPEHHGMNASIREDIVESGETVSVEATTLDELLAEWPRVDLVKIDVEGAEELVWRGMRDVVDLNPAITILLEVNSSRYDDAKAFYRELEGCGFPLRYVDFDGEIKAIDIDRLAVDRFGDDWMLFLARTDARSRAVAALSG